MKLLKSFLQLVLIGTLLSNSYGVVAAAVDHFAVQFDPLTAQSGEALDLTIQAVDKNDELVTDYTGTVLIFSESDPEAELPGALEENTYTFTSSDQGNVQFENAIIFKSEGLQDLYVYDLNDDSILGIGEVTIEKNEKLDNFEISILSPESGVIVAKNNIAVSGSTQKNHNIVVTINNDKTFETSSDNSGIFEIQATNLSEGENTIIAEILNADNQVVGTSGEIKIQISSNAPELKNLTITPESLDAEGEYNISLIATPGLTHASIVVDDVIIELTESSDEPGIYSATSNAPQIPDTYSIDLVLKDELNHETKELGAASITVNEVVLNSAEPEVTPAPEEDEPEISNLKVVSLKTKSILTWDKLDGAHSYNVYKKDSESDDIELIENVEEPRFEVEIIGDELQYEYFAVKAVFKEESGEIYEGALSDATKVKTGPETILLLILSLFIGGCILFVIKKRA